MKKKNKMKKKDHEEDEEHADEETNEEACDDLILFSSCCVPCVSLTEHLERHSQDLGTSASHGSGVPRIFFFSAPKVRGH